MKKLLISFALLFVLSACTETAQESASRHQEQCVDRTGHTVLCSFSSAARGWGDGARAFGDLF